MNISIFKARRVLFLVLSVVLGVFLVAGSGVRAATPSANPSLTIDPRQITKLNVELLAFTSVLDPKLKLAYGTFTLQSQEQFSATGDLYYKVSIMKLDPILNSVQVIKDYQSEFLQLNPGEMKQLKYQINLPEGLPSGKYIVSVNLNDLNGVLISQSSGGISDYSAPTATENQYLSIDSSKSFFIQNSKNIASIAGASYQKGETPNISVNVNNPSSQDIEVIPHLKYSKSSDATFSATEEILPTQTLKAGMQDLTYRLGAQKTAGNYDLSLTYFTKEGIQISGQIEYNWKVMGEGAKVMTVHPVGVNAKLFGYKVYLKEDLVGNSVDPLQSLKNITLDVQLSSKTQPNQILAETVQKIDQIPFDGLRQEVLLDYSSLESTSLGEYIVKSKILNQTGDVLYSGQKEFSLNPVGQNNWNRIIYIIIIVLLVLGFGLYKYNRPHKYMEPRRKP